MTTFRERNQRITDRVGYIVLLEITNPSFSGPMRICNDIEDFASRGESYIGLPFGFTTPEDVADSNPTMKLSIDNVGRGITDELEGISPGTVTMAKLIVVPRDMPDTHSHVFMLPIISVSVSGAIAEATASVDQFASQAACKQKATPFTLPGIFP